MCAVHARLLQQDCEQHSVCQIWCSNLVCRALLRLLPTLRFGVEQRGRLLAKASPAPHVLHMTATPIPRTQVRYLQCCGTFVSVPYEDAC